MTDVNLRAIISILTKKEGHFLWDWVCPILFFKAIVILTLKMSADVVWRGWSTVGAVRAGEKGCPGTTRPGDARKVPALLPLPS